MDGHKLFWIGLLSAVITILIGLSWQYIEETFWYIYEKPITLLYVYGAYSFVTTIMFFNKDKSPHWINILFATSVLGIISIIVMLLVIVSIKFAEFIIKQVKLFNKFLDKIIN